MLYKFKGIKRCELSNSLIDLQAEAQNEQDARKQHAKDYILFHLATLPGIVSSK